MRSMRGRALRSSSAANPAIIVSPDNVFPTPHAALRLTRPGSGQ